MNRPSTRTLAVAAGLGAGALALAALTRELRTEAETVPATVVAHVGEVELRRYPRLVAVETTADSDNEAFGRLFRYIAGANDGGDSISMTAPVTVDGRGTDIAMTAPVEVGLGGATDGDDAAEGVQMAFFLPAAYSPETAPVPTDERVELVTVPERTLAVRRFSWWPTAGRIASEREALLSTLADAGIETAGEPFFMGYDAPWTLPFRRRNEVAVEVDAD